MSVFGTYAQYYDRLYSDKDYAAEVEFLKGLLPVDTASILELGCGTGRHAELLAADGFSFVGVDLSSEMLAIAERRGGFVLVEGDIRKVRVGKTFDAVVSLFHVINYSTTNDELSDVFATANEHLKPGGLFIFDTWHGPAVESDSPSVRVKRFEDEEVRITRISEPTIYRDANRVDVNYQLFVKNKRDGSITEIAERHAMRYLFPAEIESLASLTGFEIVDHKEWLTTREPSVETWSTYFVAQKVGVER